MTSGAPGTDFTSRLTVAGTRLGRYVVGPRIGSGGTASVYLARLADNPEQLVALKVVHEHLADEKEFIHQFLDEANLLLRLNHPNIVSVHELGREEQTLFLAIEYLDGEPLSRLYSALRRRNQRLEPDLIAWIGARVAEGLDYAHRLTDEQGQPMDLVHRDISPQNVFLTMDGRVKLIDFGIARAAGRIAQTTIGKIKGKFSYMAPEQVLSSEFDHRVDLFALGATLYEGAVGSRLFAGSDETDTLHKLLFEEVPDPRTQVPDFPDELARILGRALESKPEERYATGHEMARDLEAFLATRRDGRARAAVAVVGLAVRRRSPAAHGVHSCAQGSDGGAQQWCHAGAPGAATLAMARSRGGSGAGGRRHRAFDSKHSEADDPIRVSGSGRDHRHLRSHAGSPGGGSHRRRRQAGDGNPRPRHAAQERRSRDGVGECGGLSPRQAVASRRSRSRPDGPAGEGRPATQRSSHDLGKTEARGSQAEILGLAGHRLSVLMLARREPRRVSTAVVTSRHA